MLLSGDVEAFVGRCQFVVVDVEASLSVIRLGRLRDGLFGIGLPLIANLVRLVEQVFGIDLDGCEVLDVELVVVVVAILLAKQFGVLGADNDRPCLSHSSDNTLLLMNFPGILVCLVEEPESRDLHKVNAVGLFYLDIEIPHDEGREIEPCHLEEQLVLVERVGVIGQDEEEFLVAVGCELPGSNGVAVVEHH